MCANPLTAGIQNARLLRVALYALLVPAITLSVAGADPITTRGDAVGQLLNEWAKEGTSAGLAGFDYENRDGQHSPLQQGLYPQLKFTNTGESAEKGPAKVLRERPTIGNCSMAAPPMQGGSLPRFYLLDPAGAQFLMREYLGNNLFIYPEHQDYDIGANGLNGFGDLYPSNNPGVLISQGSSGSDMPFVKAFLATAAAFPPDTQKILIEKRLLMPTLQAIFRLSNRMVKTQADYLSGKAHPPVFDSADLDEEKMIRTAHSMTPDSIPPIPLINVEEETEFAEGKNFFEPPKPHPYQLANTLTQVSRIVRGNQPEYGMIVNAARTGDYKNRPVKIAWQLLHGDPKMVKIDSSGKGPWARIKVRFPLPSERDTGIRTHRVDIGVFAVRDKFISAPAIISFYFLPNERHFYDSQGRVSEIHYQTYNPDLGLPPTDTDPRWIKLMMGIAMKGDGIRSRLTEQLLKPEEVDGIQEDWFRLKTGAEVLEELRRDEQRKEHAGAYQERLGKDIAEVLAKTLPGERKLTVRAAIVGTLNAIAGFTDLYPSFQAEIDARAASSPKGSAAADIRSDIQRLMEIGVVIRQASGHVMPMRPLDQLNDGERYAMRGLNLTILSQVLFPEGLDRSTAPAWVDPRLTVWKHWRDVYRYDEETGDLLGWIRHFSGRTLWFSSDGFAMPEGPKGSKVPVNYARNGDGLLEFELTN